MQHKLFFLIPDGVADYKIKSLGDKTPLAYAYTPNLDNLCSKSILGRVKAVPDDMEPGSDVSILSLLGYDPKKYYTGRSPLEAISIGVNLNQNDVSYRCNLISTDGEILLDYSGGHISTEEATVLINAVKKKLQTDFFKFYAGISYRHLMVWKNGSEDFICNPPHNVMQKKIKEILPGAKTNLAEKNLKKIINLHWNSLEILDNHELNKKRRDEGKLPANMIWLWGQGKKPFLPNYKKMFDLEGSVISAVDLIKGIAKCANLKVVEVSGATGYYDTNYSGKAQAAIEEFKKQDFVLVHIESTDEAGHSGDLQEKIKAIEIIDKEVLGRVYNYLRATQNPFKILISPDHYTPVEKRTHVGSPVPFLMFSSESEKKNNLTYCEEDAQKSDIFVDKGYELMKKFIKYW